MFNSRLNFIYSHFNLGCVIDSLPSLPTIPLGATCAFTTGCNSSRANSSRRSRGRQATISFPKPLLSLELKVSEVRCTCDVSRRRFVCVLFFFPFHTSFFFCAWEWGRSLFRFYLSTRSFVSGEKKVAQASTTKIKKSRKVERKWIRNGPILSLGLQPNRGDMSPDQKSKQKK